VFVIAKPLSEAAARDVVLYSVTLANGMQGLRIDWSAHGLELLGQFKDKSDLSLIVAADGEAQDLSGVLMRAGAVGAQVAEIGSHTARFDVSLMQTVAAQ
jgi:hypothetical protein